MLRKKPQFIIIIKTFTYCVNTIVVFYTFVIYLARKCYAMVKFLMYMLINIINVTWYHYVILIGDLNYNVLNEDKGTPLTTMCDIFYYTNLVKTATCHIKNANPTLIDVILTNKPSYCQNITNFNCGLSDVHNLISFQLKGYVPKF
jgi:hypothetical protein